MQLLIADATWRIETRSHFAFFQITFDLLVLLCVHHIIAKHIVPTHIKHLTNLN